MKTNVLLTIIFQRAALKLLGLLLSSRPHSSGVPENKGPPTLFYLRGCRHLMPIALPAVSNEKLQELKSFRVPSSRAPLTSIVALSPGPGPERQVVVQVLRSPCVTWSVFGSNTTWLVLMSCALLPSASRTLQVTAAELRKVVRTVWEDCLLTHLSFLSEVWHEGPHRSEQSSQPSVLSTDCCSALLSIQNG